MTKQTNHDWPFKNILVTGGHGFIGSKVVSKLREKGSDVCTPSSGECDLRKKGCLKDFVKNKDVLIHMAASVGSLEYNNTHQADILSDNCMMAKNVINVAKEEGVKKFIGIGSIRMYSPSVDIPFKEEDALNGSLFHNSAYASAKRLMLSRLQDQHEMDFAYLILTNTYGPGMRLDKKRTGIAEIIAKIVAAKDNSKNLTMHGSGNATRDFLYVDDAVDAIIYFLEHGNQRCVINVGTGEEVSIRETVDLLAELHGYPGCIKWDTSRAEGDLRAVLNTSLSRSAGFFPKTTLVQGMKNSLEWYCGT